MEYLKYKFEDNEELISTYDETPLWSAPFGLFLLDHLELKPNLTVVDIGSGSGFPLIELASRLGGSCKLYGVDIWKNANQKAKQKIKNRGLRNIEIIETSAEKMPFETNSVDLIVSNLGINNFKDKQLVFKECNRILKPNSKLVITTNPKGHWKEFYQLIYSTLLEIKKPYLISVLEQEEELRGSIESISTDYENSQFKVIRQINESFKMKFLDGGAFLNHHFIKLGWLSNWMKLLPKDEWKEIFAALEYNLNEYALKKEGLQLTVPMLYMEGIKIENPKI